MPAIEEILQDDLTQNVEALGPRLRWLSAWMIHRANNLRESRDSIKVGGHQASCASMSTIMAALFGTALRPQDKVAVNRARRAIAIQLKAKGWLEPCAFPLLCRSNHAAVVIAAMPCSATAHE